MMPLQQSTRIPQRPRLLPLLLAIGLAGCGAGELTSPDGADGVYFDPAGTGAWPAADWYLVDARLDGDTLALRIQYSGGCALHRFWLVAGPWTELPTFGPYPTYSLRLDLAHDDRGDACEAALTETRRFDLTPLRQAYRSQHGPGPALILLEVPIRQRSDQTDTLDWMLLLFHRILWKTAGPVWETPARAVDNWRKSVN